jgi:hypothetical protein
VQHELCVPLWTPSGVETDSNTGAHHQHCREVRAIQNEKKKKKDCNAYAAQAQISYQHCSLSLSRVFCVHAHEIQRNRPIVKTKPISRSTALPVYMSVSPNISKLYTTEIECSVRLFTYSSSGCKISRAMHDKEYLWKEEGRNEEEYSGESISCCEWCLRCSKR